MRGIEGAQPFPFIYSEGYGYVLFLPGVKVEAVV